MGHAEFTLRNQPAQAPLSLDELWMPFTPNRDFKSDPRIVVRAEGMGIIVIGVVAYLFDLLMRYVERLVVPWKGKV